VGVALTRLSYILQVLLNPRWVSAGVEETWGPYGPRPNTFYGGPGPHFFQQHIVLKSPLPQSDGVTCGPSLSFVHIVFVYLLVNELCVRLRTTAGSYIYVLKRI